MRDNNSSPRCAERGAVAIFVALLLPILLGLLAVVLDGGILFDTKRRMQTAADNAAVTGAWEVKRGSSLSTVQAAAKYDAGENHFTDGSDGVSVTVNQPPTSGPMAGVAKFVEVIITQPRTPFVPIFGSGANTVTARAVAGTSSANVCLLALKASGSSTFVASGGAVLDTGPDCRVVANSSSSGAMVASGGSCVSGGEIDVTGTSATGSCYTPAVDVKVPATPDPFADLAAPTPSGCAHDGFAGCLDNSTECKVQGATATLHPGVYCGGILLKGGAHVTMMPGLYILPANQDFTISQNTTVVSGTGVTIFMSAGTGQFEGNGGPTVNLAAPTSGPWEAILLFQDRTNSQKVVFSGGASTSLEGVIYAKASILEFSGGSSSTAAYTVMVSDTMKFTGGSTLGSNYTSLASGSPTKRISLAE